MDGLTTSTIATWAMLGVIGYLVKVIVRVDRSMLALEIRIEEHERRLTKFDHDIHSTK